MAVDIVVFAFRIAKKFKVSFLFASLFLPVFDYLKYIFKI